MHPSWSCHLLYPLLLSPLLLYIVNSLSFILFTSNYLYKSARLIFFVKYLIMFPCVFAAADFIHKAKGKHLCLVSIFRPDVTAQTSCLHFSCSSSAIPLHLWSWNSWIQTFNQHVPLLSKKSTYFSVTVYLNIHQTPTSVADDNQEQVKLQEGRHVLYCHKLLLYISIMEPVLTDKEGDLMLAKHSRFRTKNLCYIYFHVWLCWQMFNNSALLNCHCSWVAPYYIK